MKSKSEKKTKVSRSHGAGGEAGVPDAPPVQQQIQASSAPPQNEKRLEPGTYPLHDAAGKLLTTLTVLWDGKTAASPSQELHTAMLAAGYKATPEISELSRALRHLASLSLDDVRTLFENLLPPIAMSPEMVRLSCFVATMAQHLGNDIQVLADDEKPRDAREGSAKRLRDLFNEAVDVLLNGVERKPHGNAKQVLDAGGVVLPWQAIAIQELMKFSGVHHRLPNMTELREKMTERLGVEVSVNRMGEVLAMIGVKLRKGPPIPKRQKGRLDEVRAKSGKRA
jgi:hypothetical protein